MRLLSFLHAAFVKPFLVTVYKKEINCAVCFILKCYGNNTQSKRKYDCFREIGNWCVREVGILIENFSIFVIRNYLFLIHAANNQNVCGDLVVLIQMHN